MRAIPLVPVQTHPPTFRAGSSEERRHDTAPARCVRTRAGARGRSRPPGRAGGRAAGGAAAKTRARSRARSGARCQWAGGLPQALRGCAGAGEHPPTRLRRFPPPCQEDGSPCRPGRPDPRFFSMCLQLAGGTPARRAGAPPSAHTLYAAVSCLLNARYARCKPSAATALGPRARLPEKCARLIGPPQRGGCQLNSSCFTGYTRYQWINR